MTIERIEFKKGKVPFGLCYGRHWPRRGQRIRLGLIAASQQKQNHTHIVIVCVYVCIYSDARTWYGKSLLRRDERRIQMVASSVECVERARGVASTSSSSTLLCIMFANLRSSRFTWALLYGDDDVEMLVRATDSSV